MCLNEIIFNTNLKTIQERIKQSFNETISIGLSWNICIQSSKLSTAQKRLQKINNIMINHQPIFCYKIMFLTDLYNNDSRPA